MIVGIFAGDSRDRLDKRFSLSLSWWLCFSSVKGLLFSFFAVSTELLSDLTFLFILGKNGGTGGGLVREGLEVSRIEVKSETGKYRKKVMKKLG